MKGIIVSVSLLLLSGCTAMESVISPQVRYGQLYALQEALTTASDNCGDQQAAFTANYWAMVTVGNIEQHSQFLAAESPQQLKSKQLVKQLYALHYLSRNDEDNCRQIAVAGNTTRELLTLLTL